MINSYNQSPAAYSSKQGSSCSIMKITIWVFTFSVLAQIIGTCIYGIYFNKKLDKIEDEMDLHEDYLFLRKIQKCMKGGNIDSTLLNCKEVIAKFRNLISEVTQLDQPAETHEKLTDRREIPIPAPGIGDESKTSSKVPAVAVHLVGDKLNSNKEGLHWQQKGYLSMLNQVSYINGKLRVDTPGVYYVYSQVSFCVNATQFRDAPFVQYIYLRRPHEKERLLLKGANSYISQTANCALHSAQLGAVFTLKKNDLIYVSVTDPSCVSYSPEFTYFGMFKLGDSS
ncbi:CD40 ligand [Pseudophryne corroboree]|uniref:CD40 ligand n=1 Tax=Pseudophryne corroboree TaxID=495146 RepID=UPI003081EA53